MEYAIFEKDKSGFIHSIDNVVIEYYVKIYDMKKIAKELIEIRNQNKCPGWEKLNCTFCSKYSWYQNIIHFNGIMHICFGRYDMYDRNSRSHNVIPMLRLEVNPNKHWKKQVFNDVMMWIRYNCTDGELKKYDYAIDVPYAIEHVIVLNSKKEKGLYKGTIYRGQRSQHGFLKVYNKAKEQDEQQELTRIEYTFKISEKQNFDNIVILKPMSTSNDESGLSKTNLCIVGLCREMMAKNLDFESYIQILDFRKRKIIYQYVFDGFVDLVYDSAIISRLLEKINNMFINDKVIDRSSCGFEKVDLESEIPFD